MEKNNTGKILKDLIIALDENMGEFENDTIEVKKMYGVFLKNNKFIICKEKQTSNNDDFNLVEFFTDDFIEFNEVRFGEKIYPWRKRGSHFSFRVNELIFVVPLKELLGKFSVKEVVSEKDVANLYTNVNKYVKENPYFVKQLFDDENKKIR